MHRSVVDGVNDSHFVCVVSAQEGGHRGASTGAHRWCGGARTGEGESNEGRSGEGRKRMNHEKAFGISYKNCRTD